MQYRPDRHGEPLSILGYGCMRFTTKLGRIDIEKAEKEILYAVRCGVNYFDTAYIYPGSEAALGEIFERNGIRDRVKIATKLPHYLVKDRGTMERYFAEQLRRLRTDHVEYYLMHMLTDVKSWDRMKELGVLAWLEEKKAAGQIKNIGFSYHGNSDMFCQLIDAYDWDFCQIQYNYMDEHSQAGSTGLHYAAAKGIPVVIMEPLRGGKLAVGLPAAARKRLEEYPVKKTPAQWALHWLWDQPEVTCVLSGMNSRAMIRENVRTAREAGAGSLTPGDKKLLAAVCRILNKGMKVGCTGCRYCMPCPKHVDIPGTFSAYNRLSSEGLFTGMREYMMCTLLRKDYTGPANCIGCGKCELHCPQQIQIRKELQAARKSLETPVYQAARKVIPLVMKY